MRKEDLIQLLNTIFIPFGYKRKGNNWILKDTEVTKIINLQKSDFGNQYYINYYYIINSLPLLGLYGHLSNRLSSTDCTEQDKITQLLNLDYFVEVNVRLLELDKLIKNKIISENQCIVTEKDLLQILKQRKHLYSIPIVVLKHFDLEILGK